jgi:hypothetical protein
VPLEANQSFVTQRVWDAFTKAEDGLNQQYGLLAVIIDPAILAEELSICAHLASSTASQLRPPDGNFALTTAPKPRTPAPPVDEAFIRGISVYLPGAASGKNFINVQMQSTWKMLTHVKQAPKTQRARRPSKPTRSTCATSTTTRLLARCLGTRASLSRTPRAQCTILYYTVLYYTILYYAVLLHVYSSICQRRCLLHRVRALLLLRALRHAHLPLRNLPAVPVRPLACPHETRSLAQVRARLARGAAHSIDARKTRAFPLPTLSCRYYTNLNDNNLCSDSLNKQSVVNNDRKLM